VALDDLDPYGGSTLIGVYGGYFGAAAGVLLLALLLALTDDTLPQIGASRNLLLGLANAVASVVFIIYGTVIGSPRSHLPSAFSSAAE
jgi:uncharacterized membrane protein YfcA